MRRINEVIQAPEKVGDNYRAQYAVGEAYIVHGCQRRQVDGCIERNNKECNIDWRFEGVEKILAIAEGHLIVQAAQKADNKVFVNIADNSEKAEGTDGLVPGLQCCENVVHNGPP